MSYNVFFISLGCAKNQVNCEQMMATVQHAGHNIVLSPEGADVAVVNTCGFLASACEEAIDNILEMAELKQEGRLKKIIVTGCMAQRYKDNVLRELPEVDAALGTGRSRRRIGCSAFTRTRRPLCMPQLMAQPSSP